jgi:hypothetical protein
VHKANRRSARVRAGNRRAATRLRRAPSR